jgi:hypothetical protein
MENKDFSSIFMPQTSTRLGNTYRDLSGYEYCEYFTIEQKRFCYVKKLSELAIRFMSLKVKYQ